MKDMDIANLRFVFWDSKFEEKYKDKLKERFMTFKLALNLFLQWNGRVIVETGSQRSLKGGWEGDSNSTMVFGDYLSRYPGHLWTCDKESEVIETAKQRTRPFSQNITYVAEDSLKFLQRFTKTIDLLYLDSLDCPREGDARKAQEHTLKELQLSLPKLSVSGIVLLDDNWYKNGAKPL